VPAALAPPPAPPLRLLSYAFGPGEAIPERHACTGANVSPALAWRSVPAGTQSLAILAEMQGPAGQREARWLRYDIPPDQDMLPEGFDPERAGWGLPGRNAAGQAAYAGPCSAPGERQVFTFRLLALSGRPRLAAGATSALLLEAIAGLILAEAELTGVYGPS
jgi:Raf kinase inhibitor-like YbhB/YbcL family protein